MTSTYEKDFVGSCVILQEPSSNEGGGGGGGYFYLMGAIGTYEMGLRKSWPYGLVIWR